MLSDHEQLVNLEYGSSGRFSCRQDSRTIVASHHGPRPNPHFVNDLREALRSPLQFPPLDQAVVPGDRVVLVIDRFTPEAAAIVSEVWRILESRQINPRDVSILQPVELDGGTLPDPRCELPEDIRQEVHWEIHDSTDEEHRSYLATTSEGERIYLAKQVVEADFVLPIGPMKFDPVIGFRGTGSVLYPGLSTYEAVARAHGQGHMELTPHEERPLRQMIDEISWLLGVQFAIQVIPSTGTGAAEVLAGATDAVYRRGKEILTEQWMVSLPERSQIVVAAIDHDAKGHGWNQLGSALQTARSLVAADGKIIILSEIDAELGPGLEIVRISETARDAFKPLRLETPPDLIESTQLAHAVDWANVYLLSHMPDDVVEDLFIIPLESGNEVERLLATAESCVFLSSAQNTYGWVSSK